jgi:hypothetical protein
MASNSTTKLRDASRCVIYCSKKIFDKLSQDPYGTALMKEVVKYASGDFEKASLLGTVIGEHAFIVFDYNNPDHLDTCSVLGFKIKHSIKPVFVPANVVHSRVSRWISENERWNLSFPRQGQVCSNIVYPLGDVSKI